MADADWLQKAARLRDAVREVEEQSALVKKLADDMEASRAAHTRAWFKLEKLREAEDEAYREFSGRQVVVESSPKSITGYVSVNPGGQCITGKVLS